MWKPEASISYCCWNTLTVFNKSGNIEYLGLFTFENENVSNQAVKETIDKIFKK